VRFSASVAFQENILHVIAGASGEGRANETPHPRTPAAVEQVLRANLSNDIEFYNFARQRLHFQITALGIALPSLATLVMPQMTNSTDLPTDI
jgi:hypothetical protein